MTSPSNKPVRYLVTAYKKEKVVMEFSEAVALAKKWALDTGRWGKVEEILPHPKKDTRAYFCTCYENGFRETYDGQYR